MGISREDSLDVYFCSLFSFVVSCFFPGFVGTCGQLMSWGGCGAGPPMYVYTYIYILTAPGMWIAAFNSTIKFNTTEIGLTAVISPYLHPIDIYLYTDILRC